MIEQAFAALSRSAASGSRTTALAPLHMMLALLIAGLLSSIGLNAPAWVIRLLGGSVAVVLALELLAYVYLLFNDRDALRSERFTIAKMRIERGLMGDKLLARTYGVWLLPSESGLVPQRRRVCAQNPTRSSTATIASATPFVWVATAQSIIDKVTRIAMRLSGTAHWVGA